MLARRSERHQHGWTVAIRSVSFDDEDEDDLHVFSGYDLMIAHYDIADLDWREVAERSRIDERRGLIIAQVATIEDLIDELLIYLDDPVDAESYQRGLDAQTIGPRLAQLSSKLRRAGLLDRLAEERLVDLRTIVRRRNQLAHGTIYCRPVRMVPIKELGRQPIEVEWLLVDRRSRESERITMTGLRGDLHAAIGAFSAMLAYSEVFVERAPRPINFAGRTYLGAPTP